MQGARGWVGSAASLYPDERRTPSIVSVTEPIVVPSAVAAVLARHPSARVVQWFRAEDYGTCERLIGYVVEAGEVEALLADLRASGIASEPARAPAAIVVYVPE
jgi:hypothetical protein